MTDNIEIAKWTRWEKSFLAFVIIAALSLYGTIAYLPYAAIVQHKFSLRDRGDEEANEKEVKRIESILSQLGTMGDMFGAVNALFTGFALTGLVYTGILQRKEIKAQQLELNRADQDRAELREKEKFSEMQAEMAIMNAKIQEKFDIEAQEREARVKAFEESRTAFLNAATFMAQTYTSMYNADVDRIDMMQNIETRSSFMASRAFPLLNLKTLPREIC